MTRARAMKKQAALFSCRSAPDRAKGRQQDATFLARSGHLAALLWSFLCRYSRKHLMFDQ